MTSVTQAIKRILKAKDAKMLSGANALKAMMEEVKGQVAAELSATVGDSYTALMMRQNLASFERYIAAFESSAGRELSSLLDAAWDTGADLVPAAMREGGLYIAFGHIPGPILSTLKEYATHTISGLSADAFAKVRGELNLGILGQKTTHQVVQAIRGSLDTPSIFKSLERRAETIAKVEMGRAYSTATVEGLGIAARSVPGMEKQWWHAGHPKTPRLSHLRLDGQHKPVDEMFYTGGLQIDYPRAPSAPAQEVINCACEVVPWHPSWSGAGGSRVKNA